jgi:hypothetical protein
MPGDEGAKQSDEATGQDGDLSDLNDELRVLLPGTTTLTAFLVILPFSSGFDRVRDEQKTVYLVTFLCTVLSLILFTAPAIQHRLQRPLRDRAAFKNTATRLMIAGMVPLSIAIPLVTELVLTATLNTEWFSWVVAGVVFAAILGFWWIIPVVTNDDGDARLG